MARSRNGSRGALTDICGRLARLPSTPLPSARASTERRSPDLHLGREAASQTSLSFCARNLTADPVDLHFEDAPDLIGIPRRCDGGNDPPRKSVQSLPRLPDHDERRDPDLVHSDDLPAPPFQFELAGQADGGVRSRSALGDGLGRDAPRGAPGRPLGPTLAGLVVRAAPGASVAPTAAPSRLEQPGTGGVPVERVNLSAFSWCCNWRNSLLGMALAPFVGLQ
jgi:hypothetical protein